MSDRTRGLPYSPGVPASWGLPMSRARSYGHAGPAQAVLGGAEIGGDHMRACFGPLRSHHRVLGREVVLGWSGDAASGGRNPTREHVLTRSGRPLSPVAQRQQEHSHDQRTSDHSLLLSRGLVGSVTTAVEGAPLAGLSPAPAASQAGASNPALADGSRHSRSNPAVRIRLT